MREKINARGQFDDEGHLQILTKIYGHLLKPRQNYFKASLLQSCLSGLNCICSFVWHGFLQH
jgi:hypothetical protein